MMTTDELSARGLLAAMKVLQSPKYNTDPAQRLVDELTVRTVHALLIGPFVAEVERLRLLCQPLQDENQRLRRQVEELIESRGIERLVHRLQEQRLREGSGRAPRWDEDRVVIQNGWLDGRCGGCGEALPASPVGTE